MLRSNETPSHRQGELYCRRRLTFLAVACDTDINPPRHDPRQSLLHTSCIGRQAQLTWRSDQTHTASRFHQTPYDGMRNGHRPTHQWQGSRAWPSSRPEPISHGAPLRTVGLRRADANRVGDAAAWGMTPLLVGCAANGSLRRRWVPSKHARLPRSSDGQHSPLRLWRRRSTNR